jgi:hypothetical protein
METGRKTILIIKWQGTAELCPCLKSVRGAMNFKSKKLFILPDIAGERNT